MEQSDYLSRLQKMHVRGETHGAWKGGRIRQRGYVLVYAPEHPHAYRATKGSGGYVQEHRLVMEKMIGRYLLPKETVHHRNGKKDDNRPENLLLVSIHAHWEEHGCPKCGFKIFVR